LFNEADRRCRTSGEICQLATTELSNVDVCGPERPAGHIELCCLVMTISVIFEMIVVIHIYIVELCFRSTSSGDRIRRESSSSQEASTRKERHRPGPPANGLSLLHPVSCVMGGHFIHECD